MTTDNNSDENSKTSNRVEKPRNPLEMIAIFASIAYICASIVFASEVTLTNNQMTLFVLFMVFFPILLFVGFMHITINHHWKLFSPEELSKADKYWDIVAKQLKINSKQRDIELQEIQRMLNECLEYLQDRAILTRKEKTSENSAAPEEINIQNMITFEEEKTGEKEVLYNKREKVTYENITKNEAVILSDIKLSGFNLKIEHVAGIQIFDGFYVDNNEAHYIEIKYMPLINKNKIQNNIYHIIDTLNTVLKMEKIKYNFKKAIIDYYILYDGFIEEEKYMEEFKEFRDREGISLNIKFRKISYL